jgi:hypothetical protein
MLDVRLAPPARHGALTVFPLLAPGCDTLPLILMADALAAGTFRVTELGGGSVPELATLNEGESDVLLLDGEQLIGARQNRTTSRSMILGARSRTTIPVSCMEQGRWHAVGEAFHAAEGCSPPRVRRHARRTEARHAATGRPAGAEVLREAQGEVWSEIASKVSMLRTAAPSGALDDVYAARAHDLEAALAAFPPVRDQVGILAFHGAGRLGCDVIGCADLWSRLHRRVLSGYVMDVLGERADGDASAEGAERFLADVRGAARAGQATPGLGVYRVLSGPVVGAELEVGERTVHVSAFPPLAGDASHDAGPGELPPLAPPSRRRRR